MNGFREDTADVVDKTNRQRYFGRGVVNGLMSGVAPADGRFIFLWVGFNAAYADEEEFHNAAPGERAAFASYFRKVVALDPGQRVYNAIWNNFSGPIRVLLHNRFVLAAPQWNRRIRGLGGTVQGLAASIRASLAGAEYRRGPEPRVRQALRPSQPARPRRRDLEQQGQPGSGA